MTIIMGRTQTQTETDDSSPLSSRVLFDKYEMGRLLGKGTFAKVYQAKNIITGESVAIKVLNKEQVKKQGLMDQIKREISVMRRVRHPNIVRLHEVMASKTKIFFAMDLVVGGELFSKISSSGRLPEPLARRYFQQLISAVHFCHGRGVSHRDIKPENLLLDEGGDLKVSDFGLSALPEQLRQDGLLHTQCGSPAYVAPEVLRKRGYDGPKADMWSCGVVLFVLLAGFLPFQCENLVRMFCKVFKADFEYPQWVSPAARRLISGLLVVDPQKRMSVPEIMEDPWFKLGYVNPLAISVDGDDGSLPEEFEEVKSPTTPSKPEFFNAFELISTMSSGFDLSRLFDGEESEAAAVTVFTTGATAEAVMERLVGLKEKGVRRVWRVREFKVRVEGERLGVTAEVFEAAPDVVVVEISRSSGDAADYRRFCEDVVRPALKDIVWSWRGDCNRDTNGNGNGNVGNVGNGNCNGGL
ncbi:CBL-interacting serine/threonine-protein kinase 25 [Acorus gramineus]|uniref:non-specific serine/threonine protein kinase n=1 Tax=Acorus gramineus TaxID=55184 RepID=A0AAV9AVH5_ACOGR|nr:CBL-interacting serine/threonine-protein kinase 25 [Acorus gramineus]